MSITKINYAKLDILRDDRWIANTEDNLLKCIVHDNVFNPSEEPCWACHDECLEEVDE